MYVLCLRDPGWMRTGEVHGRIQGRYKEGNSSQFTQVLNSLSRGVSEQPTHETGAFVVASSTKGVPGMNSEV